ncbi:hypothetical protein [Roseofilum casamattae]|uniref:Secreted protein n=1 Tax=Roseofilum casamattae BLCC-M143 TaxID=3022442 RepID=A0ABT7BXY7_9CYAN|nr:hypothetical protein [Roseofilum casamattae]MDJ1184021.1 hypothetical protein [Roseofilum casamattae BLCC-M143]
MSYRVSVPSLLLFVLFVRINPLTIIPSLTDSFPLRDSSTHSSATELRVATSFEPPPDRAGEPEETLSGGTRLWLQ